MLAIIDTSTYADAAQLLVCANQDAAAVAEALFDALGASAQSTGTTAGAAQWADSYMGAAEQVSAELSGLVDALGNAALLLDASGHNHARAEAAAAPYGLPAYALPQRPLRSIRMAGVPPIYGGNADEPFGWGMIVAHLAGHTWPGADLTRLAALAAAWRSAGSGIRSLAYLPDRSAEALATMRSAELPAAIAACSRLAAIARSLADDCDALAAAVSAFANEVGHQRDPIRSIIVDLAQTIGLCEVGGAITGPLGEWGANAFASTRITRAIGRILGLLAGLDETLPHLRPLLPGASADAGWLAAVADTRPVLADIRANERVLMSQADKAAGGSPVGGRSGSLTDITVDRLQGWEEASGSHTLARHVGRTEQQLTDRIAAGNREVSTFPNLDSASESITQTLKMNETKLREWLRGSNSQVTLKAKFDDAVGTVMNKNGRAFEGHAVRVIVRRDPTDPQGFRVHTAYVEP